MVIAVDFDGTIVEHRYPEIGKEIPFATATLRQLIADGHELILWTVREGDLLRDAVEYCRKRGVVFFAVNRDFEEEDGTNSDFSRKIRADLFIDDRNVGGLPSWSAIYALINNGKTLEQHLIAQGTLPKPKRWWWPF